MHLERVSSLTLEQRAALRPQFFRVLLVLCLALAGMLATIQRAEANDGYPDSDAVDCSAQFGVYSWCKGGTWYSSRGYGYRNCTDYVAWKLQSLGVPSSRTSGLGNGGEWATKAQGRAGVTVNQTPAYGAAAVNPNAAAGFGHVSFVESVNSNGTITISEYNYGTKGGYGSRTGTKAQLGITDFVHFGVAGAPSPSPTVGNGTYIQAVDTGRVYVMAGGSPMYVSSWASVGGQKPISHQYWQQEINAMPAYPADGTAIRRYSDGSIYVVAGGFPFGVTSLSKIPNTTWVNIDGSSLGQLRSQPADGTAIRNYSTGGIYVVSGNAPLAVASLSRMPAGFTWTNIDGWGITNQLQQYPKNGSFIFDETGTVHIVAGGSATTVKNFANVPAPSAIARVDSWAVNNQLRQYPLDGTVVRRYSDGSGYVVAGGAALPVLNWANVPYTSYTNIDGWAVANDLLSYPVDGTYVKGYQSGNTYLVSGGTTSQVTSGSPAATIVDDYAITNVLHPTN